MSTWNIEHSFHTHITKADVLSSALAQCISVDNSKVSKDLTLYSTFLGLANGILKQMHKSISSSDLSEGRLLVLATLLTRNSHTASPSEIAEISSVTRATVTGLINGLEREGFVLRQMHPSDKRRYNIQLTPQGETVIKEALPLFFNYVQTIMSALDDRDQEDFHRIIVKINQVIESNGDQ